MELLALHRISICHPEREEEKGSCQHPVWKTGRQSLGTAYFERLFKSLLKEENGGNGLLFLWLLFVPHVLNERKGKLVWFFFFLWKIIMFQI